MAYRINIDDEDIVVDNNTFPVGKVSDTGEEVTSDTIGIVLYDMEDLDNFGTIDNFNDAELASFDYPVLILRDFDEMTADYMQGWVDNNFFSQKKRSCHRYSVYDKGHEKHILCNYYHL